MIDLIINATRDAAIAAAGMLRQQAEAGWWIDHRTHEGVIVDPSHGKLSLDALFGIKGIGARVIVSYAAQCAWLHTIRVIDSAKKETAGE